MVNAKAETEHNSQILAEERRKLEEEKKKFERNKLEFSRKMEIEDRRLEQQQRLFDMKFKILEEELMKLATEKKQVEKQKAFYQYVNEHEAKQYTSGNVVKGEMFFSGVGSKQSLKKRYKELIKIYHPDNLDGDTNTLQEINREFDALSRVMG